MPASRTGSQCRTGEKTMKHSLHFRDRILFGLANVAAAVMMFEPTAIAQSQAPLVLDVPAKSVPVPTTVSPQMQKIIGLPLRSNWNVLPKTGEEWKPVAEAGAAATIKNIPGISERPHDLRDPLPSPVYGDMQAFPPTILTSGTRDPL